MRGGSNGSAWLCFWLAHQVAARPTRPERMLPGADGGSGGGDSNTPSSGGDTAKGGSMGPVVPRQQADR